MAIALIILGAWTFFTVIAGLLGVFAHFRKKPEVKKDVDIKPISIEIDLDNVISPMKKFEDNMKMATNEILQGLKANLESSKTVVEALIGIKDSANAHLDKTGINPKSPEYFVSQLMYARDNFATRDQKKVVDAIISKIQKHGKTKQAKG